MKQQAFTLRRRVLAPEDVRELCHQVMPVGDGEAPVRATGWTDRRGRWKRIEVLYANGWRLSFAFDLQDQPCDVSARQTFTIKPAGAAA